MNDAGQKLARDLVHVRNHQKKSLRRGISSCECAGSQRAVNGSGSSRRSGYNVPHMPKYKPESVTSTLGGGSYPPVSSTTHNPKIQQQDVPPASTDSTKPPVSNTPYTPKVPPEADPPVYIDNLWPEPPEPANTPPDEASPTINVPSSKSDRDNKTNPKE